MTFRATIVLAVVWLSSLVAVGAWAQTRVTVTGPPRILSGSDIAFRVDRTDVEGAPVGSLVVKISHQRREFCDRKKLPAVVRNNGSSRYQRIPIDPLIT